MPPLCFSPEAMSIPLQQLPPVRLLDSNRDLCPQFFDFFRRKVLDQLLLVRKPARAVLTTSSREPNRPA
jgi:hypothetical protein